MSRRAAAVIIGTVCIAASLTADISGYTDSGDTGWQWIGLYGLLVWIMFAFEKDRTL